MSVVKKEPGAFKQKLSKRTMIIERKHIEVKDIADYCMVNTCTVRRWLKDRKLRSIKLPSNQYRISVADFKDFLKRYDMPIEEDFFQRLSPLQ